MDKKSFREESLKRVKSCKRRWILDKFLSKRLDTLIEYYNPDSVLFYIPMDIEPNICSLLREKRKKMKIFTPFIVGESFKMVDYRLPLKLNSFNIYESASTNLVHNRVDMVIVPVVGVDGNFKRVGFGKGMYDRFYEKLKSKPIVVFVQRVECKTSKVVTDFYDIKADYYITPKKIQKIGKRDDNRDLIGRRWSHSWRHSNIF